MSDHYLVEVKVRMKSFQKKEREEVTEVSLFYSFHCLSFSFLKDIDSRKGTLCPFCVPIHKKK